MDIRYTRYVATATQNVKVFRNFGIWTRSHIMDILGSQNKNGDFGLMVSL